MGEVWRGHHDATGLPVAAKVVREELARVPEHVATFRNEVRAMARLNHPCILTVLDYGEVDRAAAVASQSRMLEGSPYLVMEYAGGGSLKDLKRRLGWGDIRRVLISLLDALAHAHASNVIHRDLKAGNVMIATADDVRPGLKLADFGIAHAFDGMSNRDDRSEQAAGTLQYMAREQLAGAWRDYGPWTDLYAVACLAWRLITGMPPHHGVPREELLQAQLDGPSSHLPEGFPPGFESWLRRMLQAEARNRFTRAADAAWALMALGEAPGPTDSDDIQVVIPLAFDPRELLDQTAAPEARGTPDAELEGSEYLGMASRIPPIPVDWRRPRTAPIPLTLHGAGLGLFPLRTIQMVGRETERDRLWTMLVEVHQRSEARFAVITGPPGCGKTTLAEWLARRAHELGAATTLLTERSAERQSAALAELLSQHLRLGGLYGLPLKQQLRRALKGASRAVRTSALELLQSIPRGPSDRFAAAEQLLRTLVERSGGIGRVGTGRPLVLVLDDADNGEPIAFARWLLDRQYHAPLPALVLVVATVDVPPRHGALHTLIAGGAAPIHLGALLPSDRAELVGGLLRLERSLAARVDEHSAGNPQLAIGAVTDLVARGALRQTEDGFGLLPGQELRLPDALHDLWTSRLNDVILGLGPEAERDLERAAILGHSVDESQWHAICDDPSAARGARTRMSLQGLQRRAELAERMLRERLVVESDRGFRFTSAAVRQSLLRRADQGGRSREHHQACVDALRNLKGVSSARVGRHLRGAGELDDAFTMLLTAAEERLASTDYRPAMGLLSEARAVLEGVHATESDPRWGEVLVALTEGARGMGRADDAERYAARAISRGREFGWDSLVRALFQGAQSAVALGNRRGAAPLLAEMEPLAAASGDPRLLGQCLFAKATLARDQNPTLLARARSLFEESDDALGMANVDRVVGLRTQAQGDLATAEVLLKTAAETYRALGMHSTLATTFIGLADVYRKGGRLREADALLQELVALHRTTDLGVNAVMVHLNLGLLRLARANYLGARRAFDQAARLGELTHHEGLTGASWASLLAPLAILEDWAAFETTLERAQELLERTGFRDPDLAATLGLALDALPKKSPHRAVLSEMVRQQAP